MIPEEASKRFEVILKKRTVKETVLKGNCLLLARVIYSDEFGSPRVGFDSGHLTSNFWI